MADQFWMERVRRSFSLVTVLVTVSAWLTISNHCALGLTNPVQKKQQDECPFHQRSAPAKPKKSDASPCCKVLRAIAAKPAQKITDAIALIPPAEFSFPSFQLFPTADSAADSIFAGVGPPGTTLFAELIGSIETHAPPVCG